MFNLLESLFYSNKFDYINIVISLCEISFTILSILTIFISIYYENSILKLKKLKWKIGQTVKIEEIKEILFEYGYIKNEQMPFYDKIIRFFKGICYTLVIIYSIIYIVVTTKTESIGGITLLYITVAMVLVILIFITSIFRTSKNNKDIIEYEKFFNYEFYSKIYNEKYIVNPIININITHGEDSIIQIEQEYPIYIYNLLIIIELNNKVFFRIMLKENKNKNNNNYTYKYSKNISNMDISRYIFENVKEDSSGKIYISTLQGDKNDIKSYKGNISIYKESENTIININELEFVNDRITRIVQDILKEDIDKEVYSKLI